MTRSLQEMIHVDIYAMKSIGDPLWESIWQLSHHVNEGMERVHMAPAVSSWLVGRADASVVDDPSVSSGPPFEPQWLHKEKLKCSMLEIQDFGKKANGLPVELGRSCAQFPK